MLEFCTRNDELAVILAHEIAHNVTHHASESISRALIYLPLFLVSCLISGIDPDLVQVGMDVAYRLPKLRKQEREADHIGLLIMAESGFDPSAALDLWSRWEDSDVNKSPNYLSTHPSHHDRFEHFTRWLRSARSRRLRSDCTGKLSTWRGW